MNRCKTGQYPQGGPFISFLQLRNIKNSKSTKSKENLKGCSNKNIKLFFYLGVEGGDILNVPQFFLTAYNNDLKGYSLTHKKGCSHCISLGTAIYAARVLITT